MNRKIIGKILGFLLVMESFLFMPPAFISWMDGERVALTAFFTAAAVAAVVGDIGDGAEAAFDLGVSGIFSINRVAVPFSQAKLRSKDDMRATAANLFRFMERLGL